MAIAWIHFKAFGMRGQCRFHKLAAFAITRIANSDQSEVCALVGFP